MLITINQACKKYRIPLAVLEDWVKWYFFPIEQVAGVMTDIYDYIPRNWKVNSDEADEWVDERVQSVIEGSVFALIFATGEDTSRQSQIIIDQAQPEFLRNYLYPSMPEQVKVAVEKAEFDDLRGGFFNGHKKSRWIEAVAGILGHNALETLKHEGDSLNNLVGFEARLYALYLRSIASARSKRHPEFKIYVSGLLGAGTFDHLNPIIIEQAIQKYGTTFIKGLEKGASYWNSKVK